MSSFNHNLRLNALNDRVGVYVCICGLLIYEAQSSFYVYTHEPRVCEQTRRLMSFQLVKKTKEPDGGSLNECGFVLLVLGVQAKTKKKSLREEKSKIKLVG